MKYTISFLAFLFSIAHPVFSQKTNDVYVDKTGVMRWGATGNEVQGFGVNYTVPFAYAYRVANQLNVPHEKAIDDDVYHFARLGLDAYRVHVWDTEISDVKGNLLENEHLKLLDYTLKKMKERGMKFILTPIAYWGNGWPEADEKTPGFSAKYGKADCLTNPDAIRAQQVYLYQFLNHVNPYTGVAYKDEPDLIAFEISNEPHHGGEAKKVTEFINGMVKSMRNTGCRKPIFYNISHSIHLADAYFDADIQGGTFQWYPTGLQSKHELQGNLLPNVDSYSIPFANNARFKKMAKIVYEFDAADVGRSYIYPAMARSFRQAGMQVATQFAYDPTYFAYANTEYDTHYMNLAYAPQKALSLKIASEVFHKVPMYKDFGKFPADTSFGPFRVSYGQDLAEMVTKEHFIYTNNTSTQPPAPAQLEQVSGYGNSAIVKYGGTGAYFLDKLESGVWRLEVMPDAIWVKDPFGRNSLKKELAVINWRSWPMKINLPDLGDEFSISALNEGNSFAGRGSEGGFAVSPGSYILLQKGKSTKLNAGSVWKNITLKEFSAPATTLKNTYVLHQPSVEVSAGEAFKLDVQVVSIRQPEKAEVWLYAGEGKPQVLKLEHKQGYHYSVTIPAGLVKPGFLKYYVRIEDKTYPSGLETSPGDWDFYDIDPYQVRVVPQNAPLTLFNAGTDTDELSRPYHRNTKLIPVGQSGEAELQINMDKPVYVDTENAEGEKRYDYSMRYYFKQKTEGRKAALASAKELVLYGRSLRKEPLAIQLALIGKDGSVYGGMVQADTIKGRYSVRLKDLKKVEFVSLPRPYPSFLPYFVNTNLADSQLKPDEMETLQLSIGPGLVKEADRAGHGVAIERVTLE